MGVVLLIADHNKVSELRALARRETNGRVASRMVAIANALDGMTRELAARSSGIDRQMLRDWVVRYNADGIDGLYDHPKGHNTEKPSDSEQAVLLAKLFRRPILPVTEHEPGRSLISVILPRSVLVGDSRPQACGVNISSLASPIKKQSRFPPIPI